jgi:antitoxin (DNA-binding transcriptional repressor) of toxin-antitoxin stability system
VGKVTEIGIFESKTNLAELIQRVLAGERFHITRRGQRVAELGPITHDRKPLTRGSARNPSYRMSDDFDAPVADLEDYM